MYIYIYMYKRNHTHHEYVRSQTRLQTWSPHLSDAEMLHLAAVEDGQLSSVVETLLPGKSPGNPLWKSPKMVVLMGKYPGKWWF